MHNYKLIIRKQEVIPHIPDSMIPMDFCKKTLIDFTTDDMTSNFEVFSKNKMDALYISEIIETDWMQTLYE